MHLVLSNNIQTTLAVGLGICQGELKKKKKDLWKNSISIFQNGSSDGGARHSVASETREYQRQPMLPPKNWKKKITPEQQLASQSSMSVNCAD